jgi:hypothetical protein
VAEATKYRCETCKPLPPDSETPLAVTRCHSKQTTSRLLLVACFGIAACSLPGCALTSSGTVARLLNREPEFQTPRQMVPVWSDTVLHQSGEPATRGVGGRIMFYGIDKHKAVRPQGTLVVYAWDDSQGMQERSPDRKFVFPAEDLQRHYSQSRLGHSYSFWLPWDAAGGQLTHLTLITRFVSTDGAELTSAPAHVVLPGPGDGVPFYQSLAKSRRLQQVELATDESEVPTQPIGRLPGPRAAQRETLVIPVNPDFLTRQAASSSDEGPVPLPPKPPLSAPRAISDREVRPAAYATEAGHSDQSSADSEPTESPAPTTAAARFSGDPRRTAPLRGQWPTALPATPRQTFRRSADTP